MKNKALSHRLVLSLALPMIVSNISTPLLGLVDTAVMGHLDSPQFLGAVALGGLIFSFIYWGFGFLRMGTTGLTAQAFGEGHEREIKAILFRALLLAQLIALLILLLSQPLARLSFTLLQGGATVEALAHRYFDIRIWSAPATLGVYVLTGWFLGMQNVKAPLAIVLVTNLSNIGLDIWLVYYLKMEVTGVALASVVSEYLGLMLGLLLLVGRLRRLGACKGLAVGDVNKIKAMLAINGNIFIRTWCLIFAFAFFTAQGARLGEVILAANAVLLNFQTFMAYALDGFAHAAEALVGRAIGEKIATS
nr:MATE family efflux transporter [Methylomarinum sp. Ch1-1]MDP4521413.1 MATE family efflux transporter [Methylomarinum sp. Ch1-1]